MRAVLKGRVVRLGKEVAESLEQFGVSKDNRDLSNVARECIEFALSRPEEFAEFLREKGLLLK